VGAARSLGRGARDQWYDADDWRLARDPRHDAGGRAHQGVGRANAGRGGAVRRLRERARETRSGDSGNLTRTGWGSLRDKDTQSLREPHPVRHSSVAPPTREYELPALAAVAVPEHNQRIAEQAQRDLPAAAPVQTGGGEAHRFARSEHAPRVVEGHQFQLHRVADGDHRIARFETAEQLTV